MHGLGGHPERTWTKKTSALPTDNLDQGSRRRDLLRRFLKSKPSESATKSSNAPSRTVLWPRDLLPDTVKDVRILTYGYNAHVVEGFFQAPNQNGITHHAANLLEALWRVRQDNVSSVTSSCHATLTFGAGNPTIDIRRPQFRGDHCQGGEAFP